MTDSGICTRTNMLGRLSLSELGPEGTAHIASCTDCAALFATSQRAAASARQAPDFTWTPPAQQRLRASLLSAASGETGGRGTKDVWARRATRIALICGASAALWFGARALMPASPARSSDSTVPVSSRAVAGREPIAAAGAPSLQPGAEATAPVSPLDRPAARGVPSSAESEVRRIAGGEPRNAEPSASNSFVPADQMGFVNPTTAKSTTVKSTTARSTPAKSTPVRSTTEDSPASQPRAITSAPTSASRKTSIRPMRRTETGVNSAEQAFAKGWEAIRNGDRVGAAQLFATAADAAPGSAISEDALYWQAVTLARLDRQSDASHAMASFMKRYPHSTRANEIGVMLGWLLVHEGKADEARPLFESASHDPIAKTRQSAQAGLDAVRAPSH